MYSREKALNRNDKIQSLINNSDLSPDGADWLVLRTDPYHDFNRPVAGYPDADAYDTIVSVRNYELNVSKPAGLAAGNWDAHVFTLPFDATTLINSSSLSGNVAVSPDTFLMGLVNVAKDATGGPLFPTADPVLSANFSCIPVDNGGFLGVQDGSSRVIGMGIEIIDTTAQLYKQGAITCYKMPSVLPLESQLSFEDPVGAFVTSGSYHVLASPPSTVGEAVVFKSTVQWEAKDGCYMVIGQQGIDNPFRIPVRSSLAITGDIILAGVDQILLTGLTPAGIPNVPPLYTGSVPSSTFKFCNITQSGAMLTGLANEATFKVRVRVIVERAPLRGEVDLIPLASPSAGYDFKALALYSRLVHELPVAVPVSFNAKGDWWRMILRTIGTVAPHMGPLLVPYLGPAAQPLMTSIGTLANNAGQRSKKTVAKKKSVATIPPSNNKKK